MMTRTGPSVYWTAVSSRNSANRPTSRRVEIYTWRKSANSRRKQLIPNIREWLNCQHGKTEYYLIQTVTGHGSFKECTQLLGKDEDDICVYCGEVDTAEHTVFICTRCSEIRWILLLQIDRDISSETLITEMTKKFRRL